MKDQREQAPQQTKISLKSLQIKCLIKLTRMQSHATKNQEQEVKIDESQLLKLVHHNTVNYKTQSGSPAGSSNTKGLNSQFCSQIEGNQTERKPLTNFDQDANSKFQDASGFAQSKYIMVFKYIHFQQSDIFTVVDKSDIYYVVEGVLRSISNEYFKKIMSNQLSSWKTYYKRVNNQINRKSDDTLSLFPIGKINNDLVVEKSYNIHHIVYQLLQPPQNTMSQIRKMIFQNRFCLLRKFLHEPYVKQPDRYLVARLKTLYVLQCLLDKNLKTNMKKTFLDNFQEIDLWFSESETEKQENKSHPQSPNNRPDQNSATQKDKMISQMQKMDTFSGHIGQLTIDKIQSMQLGVLRKILRKAKDDKQKQRSEQAEFVKLDENLKVIIFLDDSEQNKIYEEKQEKTQKKEPENKNTSLKEKLKQCKSPNPSNYLLKAKITLVENPEEKLLKITKFRLTHYFGYAQYLKRDGLFDYFEPELISKVQQQKQFNVQLEENQKKRKQEKKKLKEQELIKKMKEKFMAKLTFSPNKLHLKIDQSDFTFKKDNKGVIFATPNKLNKAKNNIVATAIPEFKFKKKVLANEIKLNFKDTDEQCFSNTYASPTRFSMDYEHDLSSDTKRSDLDSSLPLKHMNKKYLGDISTNLKEEEFKKQIIKLKPVVDENMRKLSIKLESQSTLGQIAETLSEDSGDEMQFHTATSFKQVVQQLHTKQPVRVKTEFNFDRRMSFMVPQDQDTSQFDSQKKRHSISPSMKYKEASKSFSINKSETLQEIPEGVTFRQTFENNKQQKEADVSEFSLDMDKKKKPSDNMNNTQKLQFISDGTTEISSAANLHLLDQIYDIESECDISERPIMFRDLKHNPQFHQQKLLEYQDKLNQIQALMQSIISDYQCDIIREKYFRSKLLKLRKRRVQKQLLEKQMKQRASQDLYKQIRRISVVQNIDQDIQNTFIKTFQGIVYLMKKKSIFSPVISKKIRHQNQIVPFDFLKISKPIYTFNYQNQLSENELYELQIYSDSSSQDDQQDIYESFSASPAKDDQPNQNMSLSQKSNYFLGSEIALVSPPVNHKLFLQDLKDECIEKFENLSQDSEDTDIDQEKVKQINTQLDATISTLKISKKLREIRSRKTQNNQKTPQFQNIEESFEEEEESQEKINQRKKELFNSMIADTKSLDFMRAFESQKKIQKERQEKLQRIQEMQKRNRPIDQELARTARQKFQKIMLDIVRSNKNLEVVELLYGMTKKAQQVRNIGTMKPQEMNKLRFAIENNNEQIIADFVQFNSQLIDNQAEDGCTLVCLAVRYARVGIVEMLLKEGADANIPCKDGMNTPLHFAVNQNQKKITNLLINYGADEKIKNYNGLTPWEGI